MSGRTLSDYKVVRKLGRGGMAQVYEVLDERTGKPLALKVLLPHLVSDRVVRQRFVREAQVGMALEHPNIVRVYEVGTVPEPFIAMELVRGKTLAAIIGQRPLVLEQVIAWGQQLADALGFAHRQGIVHRDVKPGNIMVADGQVKLMDFGLARVVDTTSLTERHEIIGSLYYMSPEQVMGDAVDERSDLFSLGVVLYEMLAARRPFYGEHVGSVIHAVLYSEPMQLCEGNQSLPREVEQVVFKAMQKKADLRYQRAIDLKSDLVNLGAVIDGQPVDLIASDITIGDVFERQRGISSELVGRDREMAVLQEHLTRMLQGTSSAILLSGEAGVGKSRLVWEFGQKVKMKRNRFLIGKCVANGSIPYKPFLDIIRNYFVSNGITAIRDLKSFVSTHAPHLRYRMDIVAALVLKQLSRDITIISKEQFWDTAAELIRAMSRDRPVVMHLDDLHWADAPTVDMLAYIMRTLEDERVLILGTYRPEDVSGKEHPLNRILENGRKKQLFHEIVLTRLDKERTRDIIHSVFEHSRFTETFADTVFRETEGNPLFILEVLKLLRDERIITRSDGGWQIAGDAIDLHIPKTVTEVIRRRIERLDKKEREIIDLAAVEGAVFNSDTLAHCLACSRLQIVRHLQNLESSHNLIHTTKQGYQFDHGKIKEVVYDSLIPELRREYHKIIGGYLMDVRHGQDEYAGQIAHHLYEAGQQERSMPYFIQAGDHSKKVFANEDALRYFRIARESVEEQLRSNHTSRTEKMMIALLKNSGQVKCLTGQYKEAIDDLEIMISRSAAISDRQEQMSGLQEIGNVFFKRSEYGRSVTCHQKALQICRELGDRHYEPKILIGLAMATYFNRDVDQALGLLGQALEAARRVRDRIHEGKAYGYTAILSIMKSNYDRAFDHFRKALRILKATDHYYDRAFFLNQMGVAYRHTGQYRKALHYLKQAYSIQERIGDRESQILSLNNIGVTYDNLGKFTLAAHHYQKGYHVAVSIGDSRNLAMILGNMAWGFQRAGDDKKALEYGEEALNITQKIGDRWGMCVNYGILGYIYTSRGEYKKAMQVLRKDLAITRRIRNKRSELNCLYHIARLYSQRGDLQRALNYAKRSVEIAEQIGIEKGQWFCFTHLYNYYFRLGQKRKASTILRKAFTIMRESTSPRLHGWLYYYQAVDKIRRGMLRGVHEDVDKCIKQARKIRNNDMKLDAQLIAGDIAFLKKNYTKAMRHARRALKASQRMNKRHELVESHILTARIRYEQNRCEDVLSHFESAKTIAKKHGMKLLLWQAYHIAGKVYLKQQEYAKARKECQNAKKIINRIVRQLDEGMRKSFLKKKEIVDLLGDIRMLEKAGNYEKQKRTYRKITRRAR